MNSKFIKHLLFFILLSLLIVSAVTAEDKNVFTEYDNSLGGFAGGIGGSGLSWQHWFGNLGIQTAAGLVYHPQEGLSYATSFSAEPVVVENFTYNIGVEGQYMLYNNSYDNWFDGALYLFAGAMHTGSVQTVYQYSKVADGSGYIYENTGHSPLQYVPGVAAGFGFELVLFDHFSVPLEIGLSGAWEYGSWVPVDAGIIPQAGFRYRF